MKKNGPWTINNSEVKYKNPWIEVVEDKVIRPDGKPGIFGTVTMVPGVSVLAIDGDGSVYLTEEFKYALKNTSVEVVSGGIDDGESPEAAAARELHEELGIKANKLINLGTAQPFTSVVACPAYLFLAQDLVFEKAHAEGTENIRLVKVGIKQAVEMVMESRIVHGASSILILKAAKYLGL